MIFVTARGEIFDETKGFQVGAVDYITKPISPPIVRARIRTHLALYEQNRVLEEKVFVPERYAIMLKILKQVTCVINEVHSWQHFYSIYAIV